MQTVQVNSKKQYIIESTVLFNSTIYVAIKLQYHYTDSTSIISAYFNK